MVKRLGLLAVGAALTGVATPSGAQEAAGGVVIDHKAVGCIIAGKYPKMNACFAPSSNVARARVYFRAEGGTSWYYVEMKSDAPCMSGILPKPRKEMVQKHVNYYVHVTDKAFTEARTEEYDPLVVGNEADCKEKLIATALSKASVQVFGAGAPYGFAAGGISTAAAVGGGAAVVGAAGGIYAATRNNTTTTTNTTTPATTPPASTTTTTTTTLPVTTTTTLAPAETFTFNLSVTPMSGTEPLSVTVDMCGSSPSSSLTYYYDFTGDGNTDFQGPICSQTRVYNVNFVNVYPQAVAVTTSTLAHATYTVIGCAKPRVSNVQPQTKICGSAQVYVQAPPPPVTSAPGPPMPSGTITPPPGLAPVVWSSQLDVEGASAQVVANGTSAFFYTQGQSTTLAVGNRGHNRIEAELVQAAGKAGTWRFDLGGTKGLVGGSLRVVAGDVSLVTADTIVFRLKGMAGERVVFSFDTK